MNTGRRLVKRDLVDLANRIALQLFNPGQGSPFAHRLVLEDKEGKQWGGWGLANARNAVLEQLRRRPRRSGRKRRA